jgi:hypothetical protein
MDVDVVKLADEHLDVNNLADRMWKSLWMQTTQCRWQQSNGWWARARC